MSAIPLSNIQEIVERTFFEAIRQELVDKEYLPDVSDNITYPNNPTGQAAWEAELLNIESIKGFAIEVFNSSSSRQKGFKKVPRIVIRSNSFLPGALGGDGTRYYRTVQDGYEAYFTPPQTTDYFTNIHIVSNTAAQERVLHSIVALALPKRGYLNYYNDPTGSFFFRNVGFYENEDPDEGLLEKIYTYEIPDLYDMEEETIEPIAPLDEITLETTIQKEDGDPNAQTDTDIITP